MGMVTASVLSSYKDSVPSDHLEISMLELQGFSAILSTCFFCLCPSKYSAVADLWSSL